MRQHYKSEHWAPCRNQTNCWKRTLNPNRQQQLTINAKVPLLSDIAHLSHLMTKPTKWHVRPAKMQISLGIGPVWSESSLSAWRKLRSLATHWVHSEDSDQTGRMPRLIWVFAGHTCHFVDFVMKRLICISQKTPLQIACQEGHVKVAEILLQFWRTMMEKSGEQQKLGDGTVPVTDWRGYMSQRDCNGKNCLDLAIENGHE